MVIGIDSDGIIECILDIQDLTESLQFHALLNVTNWTIRCNGSKLAVTQSLHEAGFCG
jgi:hypothetical protein